MDALVSIKSIMPRCPFCTPGFQTEKALKCHMLMVISCRSRLVAQVPPLPSVVERPVSYSGGIDDNVARRPSTRLMTVPITSDEVHNFPDDMSDVIPEPPSNPPVSTGPRRLESYFNFPMK